VASLPARLLHRIEKLERRTNAHNNNFLRIAGSGLRPLKAWRPGWWLFEKKYSALFYQQQFIFIKT
jgi:hypothetical protein